MFVTGDPFPSRGHPVGEFFREKGRVVKCRRLKEIKCLETEKREVKGRLNVGRWDVGPSNVGPDVSGWRRWRWWWTDVDTLDAANVGPGDMGWRWGVTCLDGSRVDIGHSRPSTV